ncbi:MAG TPA: insulinase family protein, partial [Burkholderiales bacterium]|nr:insulinase family protein [Burkholderiales bacterium]
SALYHVPPGSHPEYAAIDVLVALLNNVPGGRLHKALVETGLASSIFGTERQQREAGFAYFGANVRQGASIDAARDALLGVLESFAARPATDEEVDLARRRLLNDIELTLADSRELTMALSECAGMGDWRILFLYRDRLKKVNADDVQAAAVHYLRRSNRTLGTFLPTASPDRAEIPAVPDLAAALKDYRGSGALAQGEDFNPTPANIESRVIRKTLPGGMKLALLPKKTRGGTVVAQLALQWGDEQSKANRAAACGITSGMLLRGTREHSREQLRNLFDKLNANVVVDGDGGSIETVRESLPESLRLMAEVLRQPSFPDDEFEQLRRASLTGIDAQRSDPAALATLALTRHLNPYPASHWLYTSSLDERTARLKDLTLEDVKHCYEEFYGASDSELSIVGDFDAEAVTRLAQDLFGDWKSPRPYARIPLKVADVAPMNETIRTPDKANAVLRAAELLKLRDDDPDYPALLLGNYIFGGSSDSRLMRRIREKEGLSYSVGSFLSADSFYPRGAFGIFAIYAPQNRERVEEAMNDELRKAFTDGFTPEEVEAGKKGFLQARQLSRSSDPALAGRLVAYLVLGRSFAWDADLERKVAALTPQQVLDAMRRHIDPAKLTVIKAGDFASPAPIPLGPAPAG